MVTRAKTVAEVRTYEFPFGVQPELVAGATISTIDAMAATPAGLTLASPSIFGTSVFVQASGGTVNTRYLLNTKVTLSTGSKLEAAGVLSIISFPLPSV